MPSPERVDLLRSEAADPQESFAEMFTDSLRSTPWLLLSAVLHMALLLLVSQIEFARASESTARPFEVVAIPEPPPLLQEILPEVEEQIVEEEVVFEDAFREIEDAVPEPVEDSSDADDEASDLDSDSIFDSMPVLGVGGGSSGIFCRRSWGTRDGPGGSPAEAALQDALVWLARHQSESGAWDTDGFGHRCENGITDGGGFPTHDVGVTGLALLAFLGAGHTHRDDTEFGIVVKRGLRWLRKQQDAEGCIGPRLQDNWIYGHAIAALAVVEAFGMTESPSLRTAAQRSVDFAHACKNPRRAWRYGVRPGEDDTSVTGWMVMLMKSARGAGLDVPVRDGIDVIEFLDDMTDELGRTGYALRGQRPVRPAGRAEEFPDIYTESMTSVGILSRVFLGEEPTTSEPIRRGAKLVVASRPVNEAPRLDFYAWYYGTLAMYQVGGASWKDWDKAMKRVVLDRQRRDHECEHGSWDPVDAWGEEGGRVYATAMLAMCLEVTYRYPRVFGVR